jgi:acetyl esterase/lipase
MSAGSAATLPVDEDALLDPDLRDWVQAMPNDTWCDAMLPGRRELIRELARANKPPLRTDVELEERRIPGPRGAPDVRVVIVRPRTAGKSVPAVLHFHGGGFVAGLPEMARATIATYAAELGAVVVSVDYRLAPEQRFPCALDDAYAALAWLHAQAGALGVDPMRIAVSGDSAGGGLSAGLALLARDRGEYPIAFQHLLFPGLDDRSALRTQLPPGVGRWIWSIESHRYAWTSLLGHAPGQREDVSPYAAPARAVDLARLPPACIQVGALDLFVDENVDYALRLRAHGVPCALHVYPGAPHSFTMAWRAPVTRACDRDALAALGKALRAGRMD